MRHFLRFFRAGKRRESERQYRAPGPKTGRPDEAEPAAAKPARTPAKQAAPRPRPIDTHSGRAERRTKPQPDVDVEAINIKAKLEAAAASEETGVFLSSLDNSAIALADTGLFKLDSEAEAEPEETGFNPYDRG